MEGRGESRSGKALAAASKSVRSVSNPKSAPRMSGQGQGQGRTGRYGKREEIGRTRGRQTQTPSPKRMLTSRSAVKGSDGHNDDDAER